MRNSLDDHCLDVLFRQARTYNSWLETPVRKELLESLYEVTKWGPTSSNGCPARFVFVQSEEARRKLLACMAPGNVEKTQSAPVSVIVAYDTEFHLKLPQLMPHADLKAMFDGKPGLIESTAQRNSALQGAYLMIAARALGLDCGPLSGFDVERLNLAFFPDRRWRVNFVCNLGYGSNEKLFPRSPRLSLEDSCRFD